MYYNYHATAKKLIQEGKLINWYITEKHNNISPALVLEFNDIGFYLHDLNVFNCYITKDYKFGIYDTETQNAKVITENYYKIPAGGYTYVGANIEYYGPYADGDFDVTFDDLQFKFSTTQ